MAHGMVAATGAADNKSTGGFTFSVAANIGANGRHVRPMAGAIYQATARKFRSARRAIGPVASASLAAAAISIFTFMGAFMRTFMATFIDIVIVPMPAW